MSPEARPTHWLWRLVSFLVRVIVLLLTGEWVALEPRGEAAGRAPRVPRAPRRPKPPPPVVEPPASAPARRVRQPPAALAGVAQRRAMLRDAVVLGALLGPRGGVSSGRPPRRFGR